MIVALVVGAVLVFGLGFGLGFFGFKIRSRWCPIHGMVKTCPQCEPGERWEQRLRTGVRS